MRITQIRKPKDAAWFVADQLAHGLIGWVPVAAFASRWQDVATAAVIILAVRELEQGRDTLEEWWRFVRRNGLRESLGDFRANLRLRLVGELHLPDRVADVSLGTLAAVGWFQVLL